MKQWKPYLGQLLEQVLCVALLHPDPCRHLEVCWQSAGKPSQLMKGREGWGNKWFPPPEQFRNSVICWTLVLQQSITTKANHHKEDNIFIVVFFLVGKTVPEVDYTVLDGCQRNLVLKCAE